MADGAEGACAPQPLEVLSELGGKACRYLRVPLGIRVKAVGRVDVRRNPVGGIDIEDPRVPAGFTCFYLGLDVLGVRTAEGPHRRNQRIGISGSNQSKVAGVSLAKSLRRCAPVV